MMKNIYHSFLPSTKYKRFCRLLICATIVQGTLQATVTTNTSPLYNIQKRSFIVKQAARSENGTIMILLGVIIELCFCGKYLLCR